MKLLYIANIRIPTEKAHGIQIMKMCEAFADAGNEVKLVVPRRINNIKKSPFEYYSVKKNFKIIKLPTLDLVKFGKIGFWMQSLSFAKMIFLYTIFKKVDFIYSRDELPLYFLSFFKKNIFLEIHSAKMNFISKRIFKKTKGIIAITQGLKDFYIKNYQINNSKILVAHDSVDLNDFSDNRLSARDLRKKYNLPFDKKIISYVGKFKTMGRSKGAEELIQVFPEVLKFNRDSFLMLVGANKSEIEEIDKIFRELKIKKSFYKIINHVSRKEVVFFLKASDLLIMNYPNIKHYAYYMSPMKLFEYMASKRPIVASSLPSIMEVLNENNSVLVKPDSPESLVNGIKKVLRDKDLADIISTQAYKDVQNYTWKKRAEKILKFTR